jgi:hypothetical protein
VTSTQGRSFVAAGKAMTTRIAVPAVIAGAVAQRPVKLMKTIALAALLTVGTVSGCAAENSAKTPAAKDLIGTWSVTTAGFEAGKHESAKSQWVVEAAEGQAFVGFKEYQDPGEDPQKEVLNGAVGVDGDIRIADSDGFFTGRMTDGKILGQYIEAKDAADSAVLNVEMSRQ